MWGMPVPTKARAAKSDQGSFGNGPFDTPEDFTLYERCITRGILGSTLPVIYGNGIRIVQSPDAVAITYEMIHDTRIIHLGPKHSLGSNIQLWMGDARGHWEGDTLVVESSNFTDRTAVGGAAHSTQLRLTESFTRVDPEMIDYEITVNDPLTFTRPWTMRLTITQQPEYEIYEYACHEGNHSMRNVLLAERAWEKEAADAKAKGLPPPPRVFEQVNGPDRAR